MIFLQIWSVPSDNGTPITNYIVQYREQGNAAWINATPNPIISNKTITGLSSGVTYEVRVAADNGVLGAYSDISTAEVFNILDLDPIAWLDAADPNADGSLPANGSKVANWAEKTGEGGDAVEINVARQPEFQTNVQNGLPAIRFNNLDRGLQGSFSRANGTALTIVVVGQFDTGSTDKALFEFNGGGNARAFFIDRRYASNTYYSPALTRGSFQLWRIENAGTTATLKEGNTTLFSGATLFNTDFTGTGTYTLGDDTTGGNRLNGFIGEILIFDRALSAADITLLETYVQNKWGI